MQGTGEEPDLGPPGQGCSMVRETPKVSQDNSFPESLRAVWCGAHAGKSRLLAPGSAP